MKLKQLFALSVLAFGIQGVAQAAYPADAEWSQIAAFESSEGAASWGVSMRQVKPHDPFPFGGGYIDD
jgi:hypothetical protein